MASGHYFLTICHSFMSRSHFGVSSGHNFLSLAKGFYLFREIESLNAQYFSGNRNFEFLNLLTWTQFLVG